MTLANGFKKKAVSIALISSLVTGIGTSVYYSNQINEIKHNNNTKEKLIIDTLQNEIIKCGHDLNEQQIKLDALIQENKALKEQLERHQQEVSRGTERILDVTVTAYDLSPESCGKYEGEEGYGVTASGVDLSGHSLWSARAIAVDPNVIPLGSKVRIMFEDEDAQQYNGIYTAIDTGAAINGNRIDIFFGNATNEALNFGVRKAKLQII
ncbi:3D domain-containing protein [Megamonas funiformis]|uniref:3D domain-containing protein n=1 Tax=Megamonas funiformis TaxID=437897 RepID=UPI003F9C3BF4